MRFANNPSSNVPTPSPPSSPTETDARTALVRHAFALEWMTVGWMIVESVGAIVAAVTARSLSLFAFGIDSFIELISGCVLLWRLTIELKHGQTFSERAERTASRICSGLLFALALYVVASAAFSFGRRRGQEFSLLGLGITVIAIPIMWWLSRKKLAIAKRLSSQSLRTDAMESITCGYLSGAIVIGQLVQLLFGAWWVDAVTSLAIVYFLVKEGREAWEERE